MPADQTPGQKAGQSCLGCLILLVAAYFVVPWLWSKIPEGTGAKVGGAIAEQMKPARPAPQRYGRDVYDQIQPEMTLDEVAAIAGDRGTQLSLVVQGNDRAEVRSWENGDGSNFNVSLTNGRVISKAQFGLR